MATETATFDGRRLVMVAVVVIAVGSAAYLSMRRDGDGPEAGAAAVTLAGPSGEVSPAAASRFTWTGSVPQARVIVIDLSAGSEPVVDRAVTGTALEIDPSDQAKLVVGKTYRWFIEYRDVNGVLHSTATMQFTIR